MDADQVKSYAPSLLYSVKKKKTGVGWRHALEVRAWTVFAEYLNLVPSSHLPEMEDPTWIPVLTCTALYKQNLKLNKERKLSRIYRTRQMIKSSAVNVWRKLQC